MKVVIVLVLAGIVLLEAHTLQKRAVSEVYLFFLKSLVQNLPETYCFPLYLEKDFWIRSQTGMCSFSKYTHFNIVAITLDHGPGCDQN